jgi:two-component system LytT family sensor kinase
MRGFLPRKSNYNPICRRKLALVATEPLLPNEPLGEPKPLGFARSLLWSLGIWTVLALLMAGQWYLNYRSSTKPEPFLPMLTIAMASYWTYAFLTLPVFWVAMRFPFRRSAWARPAAVHLLALVLFTVSHGVGRMLIYPIRSGDRFLPRGFDAWLLYTRQNLYEHLWMYLSIAGIAVAFNYYRALQARELREARLQARVADYELQVLKMQLHPHFLFNTLHAIATLMGRDVTAARRMITRLSDLLRIALSHGSTNHVRLKDELEFLEAYIEIEQTRFGDRLVVSMDIPADVLDAQVPNLLLQPLVENAVRHGISAQRGAGRIDISAARLGDRLCMEISNDGPPFTLESPRRGAGVGLVNTRARLQQLYGPEHVFEIADRPQGGVRVRLEIPFTTAEQESNLTLAGVS